MHVFFSGLNPTTNYTVTVAAATRAGIGPESPLFVFTTALKKSQIDLEVQEPNQNVGFLTLKGYGFNALIFRYIYSFVDF